MGLAALWPCVGVASGALEAPRLRFKRLTTDQGLSDSTVEAVLQDHRGFMWFGSAAGLSRYDGYEFKVYVPDEADPGSMEGSYVWTLFEDRDGVLWIGTSHGLSRYVRETDSFVTYRGHTGGEHAISSDFVQDIVEDAAGNLWVATGAGLNRLDRATGRFERYQHDPADAASLSDDTVQALCADRQGRLWVGTAGGLNLLEAGSRHFMRYRHDPRDRHSLSHDSVRDILQDRQGRIWLATDGGLDLLDPVRPGRITRWAGPGASRIATGIVWALLEDARGALWLGTDRGGLAYIDEAAGELVHYLHDPSDAASLSGNAVYSLYEDRVGDLWIGNYAGGVNFVDRASTAFEFHTSIPGRPGTLNHNSVLSFLEDAGGRIWVGTEDGLARFDRAAGRFVQYRHDPGRPDSLSAPPVTALHQDRDGVFWVGTYHGGLNRFEPATGRFARVSLGPIEVANPLSTQVWSIADDRHGRLWVGTAGGLIGLDRATGATETYQASDDEPSSLAHNIVWALHEDRAGRLWVGTHQGLSRYDREAAAFVNLRHEPANSHSLSHDQIATFYEDGQGRLWIGTHGGGLNLFDPQRGDFRALGVGDGLPSAVVLSITEDQAGNLWLGTNRGLSRFEPAAGRFVNFDHNDGLQSRQFNRGAALTSRDGLVLLGGIRGFNLFAPRDVAINDVTPPVVITDFQIFNRSVPIGERGPLSRQIGETDLIEVRHDQSVLTFEFAALNFRNPARNQYAYRLEGFDPDWVSAGAQRSVTYTNLDPGAYTFRVKASNNSGVWNETGATVRMVVTPPVWATWWFRLLALLVLSTLVLAIHRMRVRTFRAHNLALEAEIAERRRAETERERLIGEMEATGLALERQNTELERFAYTVSHDLKSPLVTIRGFLGLLQKDIETGDEAGVRRDLQQIGTASDTMARLLRDVLELSRVGRVANPAEELPLTDLAVEAAGLVSAQVEELGVELEIQPDMPTVVGDRIRLLEVFQNLIANAVRFMEDQSRPRVSVGGWAEEDRVVCLVCDNGKGIEPRYQDKIFGLFERLDPEAEGSGIGLALVKRIVEVHGGRIWVESEGRGQGATFWFSLARRPDTRRG